MILTERLTLRLSVEDRRRLEELAAAARRKPSDLIRFLINEEYDDVMGNKDG